MAAADRPTTVMLKGSTPLWPEGSLARLDDPVARSKTKDSIRNGDRAGPCAGRKPRHDCCSRLCGKRAQPLTTGRVPRPMLDA